MVQRKGEPAGVPKLGLGSVSSNQNAGKMKIALPLDQVSSSANNNEAMESSRRSNRKPPLPPTGGNSGRASAPPSENATPVIGLNLQNMSVPLHSGTLCFLTYFVFTVDISHKQMGFQSGQMQGAASVALNNTPRFANEAEQEAYMMKLLEDEEAFHSGISFSFSFPVYVPYFYILVRSCFRIRAQASENEVFRSSLLDDHGQCVSRRFAGRARQGETQIQRRHVRPFILFVC
jgi:hypothetical protein